MSSYCVLLVDEVHHQKSIHRNTKPQGITTDSNVFIILGALKSVLCFLLDIDVNGILNYPTNYLQRKCRKKAMANK